MATHSSILAWRIPWTDELGRLVRRVTKSWTRLSDFHSLTHSLTWRNNSLKLLPAGQCPGNLLETV